VKLCGDQEILRHLSFIVSHLIGFNVKRSITNHA